MTNLKRAKLRGFECQPNPEQKPFESRLALWFNWLIQACCFFFFFYLQQRQHRKVPAVEQNHRLLLRLARQDHDTRSRRRRGIDGYRRKCGWPSVIYATVTAFNFSFTLFSLSFCLFLFINELRDSALQISA